MLIDTNDSEVGDHADDRGMMLLNYDDKGQSQQPVSTAEIFQPPSSFINTRIISKKSDKFRSHQEITNHFCCNHDHSFYSSPSNPANESDQHINHLFQCHDVSGMQDDELEFLVAQEQCGARQYVNNAIDTAATAINFTAYSMLQLMHFFTFYSMTSDQELAYYLHLHIRLGHASVHQILETLKGAGRKANRALIIAAIQKCGCPAGRIYWPT